MNINITPDLFLMTLGSCYPLSYDEKNPCRKDRIIFIKKGNSLTTRRENEQIDAKKASFNQITQWAMTAIVQQKTETHDLHLIDLHLTRLRWIANHTAEKHFGNNFMGRLKQLFSRCLGFLSGKGFCTPVDTVLEFCDATEKKSDQNASSSTK